MKSNPNCIDQDKARNPPYNNNNNNQRQEAISKPNEDKCTTEKLNLKENAHATEEKRYTGRDRDRSD